MLSGKIDMATSGRFSNILYRPGARFALLSVPGVLFVVLFLFVPLISILVFSFWRTENHELFTDWNLSNCVSVLGDGSYMVFLVRSFLTALIVSAVCLVYSWPVANFIAKLGGRYRLLLLVALETPFFTGLIFRLAALQSILDPIGIINMVVMDLGMSPIKFLMYTKIATGIGLLYLYVPFMVIAIYLSLLNFNFCLLDVAKLNGAKPWCAFLEITWPLNWAGTAIGFVLVFIPCLASSVTPHVLGGANGALFGLVLGEQFAETGTWAKGSAMGVVLFIVSFIVILIMWRTVNLRRSGFTGAGM